LQAIYAILPKYILHLYMTFCSFRTILFICALVLACRTKTEAQSSGEPLASSPTSGAIPTALPFLRISPDAKSGSMGDAGVATPADPGALYSNPSKIAFATERAAIALSYSPWLRNLTPDMYISYLSGYYRLDNKSTLGMSAKYFSMGNIQLKDELFSPLGTYSPIDLALDATYARRFGESLALATTFRFIYSDISDAESIDAQTSTSATALTVDISAHQKMNVFFGNQTHELAFGINISNIGNKLSYLNSGEKMFLPTNLKLGSALTLNPGSAAQMMIALDFNKLLVPTSPRLDSEGQITAGRDASRSVASGIFGSFSDAPGGFAEELQEVSLGLGMEYLIDQKLGIRAGYHYENPNKGSRRYLTMGAGYRYSQVQMDFAYLLTTVRNSPLANSLRVSLMYAFR